VDHFDPVNGRTYQQRYTVNADNYVPGGPIFRTSRHRAAPVVDNRTLHATTRSRTRTAVFLGGEAPVEFFDFQTVLPRSLTKQFGTLCVCVRARAWLAVA
jgi:hypothetical protein